MQFFLVYCICAFRFTVVQVYVARILKEMFDHAEIGNTDNAVQGSLDTDLLQN